MSQVAQASHASEMLSATMVVCLESSCPSSSNKIGAMYLGMAQQEGSGPGKE